MVLVESPDGDDRMWLQALLRRHQTATESLVAERLLGDWETAAELFVKVMPTDYKRVLEAAAAARASGRDEVTAIMTATGV
jgi:glutamate synthase (NADPH/NADH) large chain